MPKVIVNIERGGVKLTEEVKISDPSSDPSEDMNLDARKNLFKEIEKLRKNRKLITFFHFDRSSTPQIPGLSTSFQPDSKEALFRVLKETIKGSEGIDLCLYTRGGDTNSVWPIINLIREFDQDFEVLVPFRCHSAGTLLAFGAKKIIMTPLAELSPVDPSTGNQFNPIDPTQDKKRLAISVEDVQAFRSFIIEQFDLEADKKDELWRKFYQPFLDKLSSEVHPLALGNVYRVHQKVTQLAERLLKFHKKNAAQIEKIITYFTTESYSHLHMICRHEARDVLGEETIEFAPKDLSEKLDNLLRGYEVHFQLRKDFFLNSFIGDGLREDVRFIGGAIESSIWSYLYETNAIIQQSSRIPPNVQLQIPQGQNVPLIPGLPRDINFEVISQGWERNKEPKGFTK